ncbi:hypothetical protein ABFS82_04G201700 [Erythranthe guttata]
MSRFYSLMLVLGLLALVTPSLARSLDKDSSSDITLTENDEIFEDEEMWNLVSSENDQAPPPHGHHGHHHHHHAHAPHHHHHHHAHAPHHHHHHHHHEAHAPHHHHHHGHHAHAPK